MAWLLRSLRVDALCITYLTVYLHTHVGYRRRCLYELSTGCARVVDIAWVPSNSALLAIVESIHMDRMGTCYRDNWRKFSKKEAKLLLEKSRKRFGKTEEERNEPVTEEDVFDLIDCGEDILWPTSCPHRPSDFVLPEGRTWTVIENAMLCYKFMQNPKVDKFVESDMPSFGY